MINVNNSEQKKTKGLLIFTLLMSMFMAPVALADVANKTNSMTLAKSELKNYDLDVMLNEFVASMENSAELVFFLPVSFTATYEEAPYPRKHAYLKRTIERFAADSKVVSTQGITVAAKSGKTLSLYIIDELASGMNEHLEAGDEVKFEAYHVYNSNVGPGLLIYSWEQNSPPSVWRQMLTRVSNEFLEHFKKDESSVAATQEVVTP
jgi:hypothetical protein